MTTKIELREVLLKHLRLVIPISGGWGYSLEDAIVFDKEFTEPSFNYLGDFVSLEYLIAEKRFYEELILSQSYKNSIIQWRLVTQELIFDRGRNYDCLRIEVNVYEEDWCLEQNKIDFSYTTEVWFDITLVAPF